MSRHKIFEHIRTNKRESTGKDSMKQRRRVRKEIGTAAWLFKFTVREMVLKNLYFLDLERLGVALNGLGMCLGFRLRCVCVCVCVCACVRVCVFQ